MARRTVHVLSEADVARMRELSAAERARPVPALERRAAGGVPRRQAEPGWYINESGFAVPDAGIVYLGTKSAQYPQLPAGLRPTTPGLVSLGISCAPVGVGQPGRYWGLDGIARRLLVTGHGGLAVGDRVGATTDSFYASANPLGPYLISGILAEPYVLAAFTGKRGDHVLFAVNGESVPVAYVVTTNDVTRTNDPPGVPEYTS